MQSVIKLNVGCGKTVPDGWVNIDKSPSVLLSNLPRIRSALRRVGVLTPEQAAGIPAGVIHANVTKRIPLQDAGADYVYSSHMIEHLSRWECLRFAQECKRVLRTGGVLRLATPDLQLMAREYLSRSSPFNGSARTPADAFCMEYRAYSNSQLKPVKNAIRKLVGADYHQWLYDHESLSALLRDAGFIDITLCSYRQGTVPDLEAVEHRERSLFVEARRP
jgi:predicted SAM-dependent methyltransferase